MIGDIVNKCMHWNKLCVIVQRFVLLTSIKNVSIYKFPIYTLIVLLCIFYLSFLLAPRRSASTDRIVVSFLPSSAGRFNCTWIACFAPRILSFYFSPRSFHPFDGCLFSCYTTFILLIRKDKISIYIHTYTHSLSLFLSAT